MNNDTKMYKKYFDEQSKELRLFPIVTNHLLIDNVNQDGIYKAFNLYVTIQFDKNGEVIYNQEFLQMLKRYQPEILSMYALDENNSPYLFKKFSTSFKPRKCIKCILMRIVAYTTPALFLLFIGLSLAFMFVGKNVSLEDRISTALNHIHDTSIWLNILYTFITYLVYLDIIYRFVL